MDVGRATSPISVKEDFHILHEGPEVKELWLPITKFGNNQGLTNCWARGRPWYHNNFVHLSPGLRDLGQQARLIPVAL